MKTYEPHRSSLGPDANLIVALVWFGGVLLNWMNLGVLSPFVPIIILFMEKESGLVKYHALQALALMIFSVLATIGLSITIIGILFIPVLYIVLFIFSLIATLRGWKYQTYDLPWIQGIVRWLTSVLHISLD